ncbi:MAG: adenylate/guanylate cyclase domain-containing protein [Spirochaetae bacterium HGW-Spirochaetae-1]|jgi:adenylate cyclase|nr:MAG: adenylate/guanylate cyclase domain-containing protein [Spirochaetae bacterium HGW-Spirochaetae-1]
MEFLKFDRNRTISFIITFVIFLIIMALYTQTTLFDIVERGAIDFRFFLRDPSEKSVKLDDGVRMGRINPRARKDIIILGIDEATIRDFSDRQVQWPFPWDIHALFTDFISTGNPLSIFFDITFLDHKEGEKELAKAIKKAGNVFLDYPFETEEIDVQYNDQKERINILNRMRFPVDPADASPQLVEEMVPPTPDLLKASRGVGFANVFPDPIDQINRQMPLVIKFNGWYYPNVDLILAMDYYGIGKDDVEIKMGQYLKLKNIPLNKMAKPNKNGEIIIPVDELGFMDINFIGGSGSFQHYPYFLFAREGTMEGNTSLTDKIVLIAAYASTGIATDQHKSPYGTTFGIEHHANALNTILNQDFLYKMSPMQNLIIMLVIAILLGFFLPRLSIIMSTIFVFFISIIYLVASYVIFDSSSIINAMLTPIIQTGLSFTLIITYRVLTEQQEKKYIRQTFSKFVSKSVVDELLKSPDKLKLGGEKKILTVLFSDIRGFTSISEKLTPEKLVEHLNHYLQAMTDMVFKYDGTLDKYVGDEIMAFWGAPIEMENHALMACKCALEQMEVLHKMNENWRNEGKPELNIGIGINTGDMVVGNMGSSSRMDYTLMGDNVNLGARLEGTNKVYGTYIIISEFTYEHVKDNVVVRELDLIKVKGKELPVKIYELLDVRE